MFFSTRISLATLLAFMMCAGLACASTMPPVRVLAEEHESEQEGQREFVEREQLLRDRNHGLQRQRNSGKAFPELASGSANRGQAEEPIDVMTELSRRNGVGAPLRL